MEVQFPQLARFQMAGVRASCWLAHGRNAHTLDANAIVAVCSGKAGPVPLDGGTLSEELCGSSPEAGTVLRWHACCT